MTVTSPSASNAEFWIEAWTSAGVSLPISVPNNASESAEQDILRFVADRIEGQRDTDPVGTGLGCRIDRRIDQGRVGSKHVHIADRWVVDRGHVIVGIDCTIDDVGVGGTEHDVGGNHTVDRE